MPSNTPNLELYMKNPATDGNDYFDVETMMNDNWEKIDDFAGVMDSVKERLDTIARTEVTLQPGLQVIELAKTAPFSLEYLTGRMLVNLLGRYGGCESLGPWESNAALVQDATQRTSGMSSFKITLGAVDAYAGITFNCTPDHYYVVLADVKAPAGGVATLSVQGLASSGSSVANGAFTTHIIRVKANAFFHQLRVTFSGASGSVFNLDSVRVYEVSAAEYAALGSMPVPERVAKYPYVDSVKPVRNPYAIRWTDANRTDIAAMLALQTDLYADPLTGANADSVFERDGQYFKTKRWEHKVLDGNQPWTLYQADTGVKYVRILAFAPDSVAKSPWAVKYDGKILSQAALQPDSCWIDSANKIAYVGIPNADSGWGDSYTPTPDEIKAYFMGWRMRDQVTTDPYSSGVKAWGSLMSGGTDYYTNTLPTTVAPDFKTPYELVYQLATPTVEPIVSEGQLTLNEGSNQIEVGTGIVLREDAKPRLGTNWDINGNLSSLKYKVSRYINVYANSRLFFKAAHWVGVGNGPALSIAPSDYDPSAVYSVTYLMLDTSPIAAFVGSVADNEKSLLADLVQDVQEASTRLSVVENEKAEKDSPAWITPTLLNGWTLFGSDIPVGYYKDSNGIVHMRGFIKNGSLNSVIFKIPVGYRPKNSNMQFVAYSSDGSKQILGRIIVNANGEVATYEGNTWLFSLDSVAFLAEQ